MTEYMIKETICANGSSRFVAFYRWGEGMRWTELLDTSFHSYAEAARVIENDRGIKVVKTIEHKYP